MGKSKFATVGAFVVGGFLLFAVGLFMIGSRRQLFSDSFEVNADFERVAGVQEGAKVRVAGMDAGEVVEITYPSSPEGSFRMRMRIIEDLHPLVRSDSVATIQTDGLVGNKLIQIQSGSQTAEIVRDGGAIAGNEPFELQDLMQRASETVALVEESVVELRGELEVTLESFGGALDAAGTLLNDIGGDVDQISGSTVEIAGDIQAIVGGVRDGEGTLGKLIQDDALYVTAREIATEIHRVTENAADVAANIKVLTEDAKSTFADLRSGGGTGPNVMKDVKITLASAREAMDDMAENMESLKRNFLFRGLFVDRGFFDLDSLTLNEYLDGALRDQHHRALRIWIPAEEIFEVGPNGRETISERGRARLSGAAGRILRYPANSPLIVEGYSEIGSIDEQYRTAQLRAMAVREYFVNEFHRDPNYTGFMAMEGVPPQAEDSNGDGEGIIVSLFFDDEAARAPQNRIR